MAGSSPVLMGSAATASKRRRLLASYQKVRSTKSAKSASYELKLIPLSQLNTMVNYTLYNDKLSTYNRSKIPITFDRTMRAHNCDPTSRCCHFVGVDKGCICVNHSTYHTCRSEVCRLRDRDVCDFTGFADEAVTLIYQTEFDDLGRPVSSHDAPIREPVVRRVLAPGEYPLPRLTLYVHGVLLLLANRWGRADAINQKLLKQVTSAVAYVLQLSAVKIIRIPMFKLYIMCILFILADKVSWITTKYTPLTTFFDEHEIDMRFLIYPKNGAGRPAPFQPERMAELKRMYNNKVMIHIFNAKTVSGVKIMATLKQSIVTQQTDLLAYLNAQNF